MNYLQTYQRIVARMVELRPECGLTPDLPQRLFVQFHNLHTTPTKAQLLTALQWYQIYVDQRLIHCCIVNPEAICDHIGDELVGSVHQQLNARTGGDDDLHVGELLEIALWNFHIMSTVLAELCKTPDSMRAEQHCQISKGRTVIIPSKFKPADHIRETYRRFTGMSRSAVIA